MKALGPVALGGWVTALALGMTAAAAASIRSGHHESFLVPDAVNLAAMLDDFTAQELVPEQGFVGIQSLYAGVWEIAPSLSLGLNLLLLYVALAFLWSACRTEFGTSEWPTIGMLANLYVFLVASGPNKDIPVLALTTCFVWLEMKRPKYRLPAELAIALIAFFFRDGYSVILAVFACLSSVPRITPRQMVAIGLVLGAGVSIWSAFAVDSSQILARNLVAANAIEAGPTGVIGGVLEVDAAGTLQFLPAYLSRVVYNAATGALFPVFSMTDGTIYPLGIAYWTYGVLLLASLIACVAALSSADATNHQRRAAAFCLFALLMVSVSRFVQPRYLMPVFPLAMAVLVSRPPISRRWIFWSTAGCVGAVIAAYALLGFPPPAAASSAIPVPAYMQTWQSFGL